MSASLFEIQRVIGEELLAAGWHASSIAISSQPGSAWVLFDPSRRIRVRMSADLADVAAEVTATQNAGSSNSFLWRLTIDGAPKAAIVAALLAAPGAEGGSARNRRRIISTLQDTGMRCDRGRLMCALSGTATWFSVNHAASATWTMPYRTDTGGWRVLTPAAHLDATLGTPAAVLTPLLNAARREGAQQ